MLLLSAAAVPALLLKELVKAIVAMTFCGFVLCFVRYLLLLFIYLFAVFMWHFFFLVAGGL